MQDLEERIKEKFERKMEKVSQRLAELSGDDTMVRDLEAVAAELDQIDAELDALIDADNDRASGVKERLEAKRERLLAKQDRLELKLDLRQEMRGRLEESLQAMQSQLQDSLLRIQAEAHDHRVRGGGWQQRYAKPSATDARKMQEERRKILEMLQEGKISAGDAAQLLDALRDQEESARKSHRRPRWVRIRVTDMSEDRVRVNLTLPVGLVRAGLRAGGSIAGVEGLDTAGLEAMLDQGEFGHILDVQDDAGGERVEIFVE